MQDNDPKSLYEEHNQPIRSGLRALGFLLVLIGGLFGLVGFLSFISAFGGAGHPDKFWCMIIGLPLVGIGISCLKAGYIRTIGKYVAGESVPVATDSVKYAAHELKPEFKDYVQELKTGLASQGDGPVERMQKLEELKKQGLISDAEYQAKRTEILRSV